MIELVNCETVYLITWVTGIKIFSTSKDLFVYSLNVAVLFCLFLSVTDFYNLQSINPLLPASLALLLFIFLSLHYPSSDRYACWAPACLSFRVWIIEVYWVWSTDGKMTVMDVSMPLVAHSHWATPVQLRPARIFAEAPDTVGVIGGALLEMRLS